MDSTEVEDWMLEGERASQAMEQQDHARVLGEQEVIQTDRTPGVAPWDCRSFCLASGIQSQLCQLDG